ncbi:MAG: cytochrome P450 [Acidobacteriota bacterium]|nr:cytochrome P450 [Acidobacteriota bacterium]
MQSTKLPGPPGLPVLGNIREFMRNPLKFFERCAREYGDLVSIQFGGIPGVLVVHPDMIREVMVTQHKSMIKGRGTKRLEPLLGNSLLVAEHEDHKRLRRLSQPSFSKKNLAAYDRHITEEVDLLSNSWRDGAEIDMSREMMRLTLRIVCRALMGSSINDHIVHVVDEGLESGIQHWRQGFNPITRWLHKLPTPTHRRFKKGRAELDRMVADLIRERREGGARGGDLLQALMAARDDDDNGRLSDEELRNEVVTMIMAGHETTANAATWTWYLLSQNPEAEARFHEEVDAVLGDGHTPTTDDLERLPYTRQVFAESMRLYPPAWSTSRTSTEDIQLGDVHIPKGTLLFVSQWIAHRDPRWYEEPLAFRPERWDNGWQPHKGAYFPFGAGVRQCIGERFAWMEGILLTAMLGRQWRCRLYPGHVVKPQAMVTLRPRFGMRMILEKRTTVGRQNAEESRTVSVS